MKPLYIIYLVFLFALVGSIAISPLLAMHGPKELATLSYNAYVPTCHQWIYRSSCVFYDGNDHWIGDCIEEDKEAVITTEFTNYPRKWDGAFFYSRNQIGINRAEKVTYGNVIGYKFPNDTRNLGVYTFMLLVGIIIPFIWNKTYAPHVAFLILAILPLAIDGTGQFLEFWESTNTVRFITGAIAGSAASVYVYAMINKR
jgi:uncharacterized membrane protein